jgi:hypothetical protein
MEPVSPQEIFTTSATTPNHAHGVDASASHQPVESAPGGGASGKAPRRRRRTQRWRMPVTDGPFAESKEMLGGPSVGRRIWIEEV